MARGTWLAWRWLLYLAAAGVIILALLVGALRLLLPLVPEYRDDIRVWANAATGYDIRFQSISASWPLVGPELSFYDVTLTRPGDAEPLLAAREFSVGVSLLRLVRSRRLSVSRLAVRGSSIRLQRTATGGFLIQGRGLEDLLPRPSREPLPEIGLDLQDIAVSYTDPRYQVESMALALKRLTVDLDRDRLAANGRIDLPKGYGRKLSVEFEAPLPLPLAFPQQWSARVSGTDLDLVRLLGVTLGETGPLRAATGEIDLTVSYGEARLQRVDARLDLADVAVGTDAGATIYQRLSGQGEWVRSATGWDAVLGKLRVRRDGQDYPENNAEIHYQAPSGSRAARWRSRAALLRLDDLFPIARAVLAGTEYEPQLPRHLRGVIRDLEVELAARSGGTPAYALRAGFEDLQLASASGALAAGGLTGSVTADGDGGRLQLDSRNVSLTLSEWFRDSLGADLLQGLLVWRAGPGGVRLLSDDIRLKAPAIDIRTRFEMQFPADAASPVIDLKASASATEARQVLRYLPLRRFPPKVVDWLERAIVAGKVPQAVVEFRGPVREFPFDRGNGVFRVALDLQDGTLDYANGWPRVEALSAAIVFDGVGMTSTSNSARLGRLNLRDYTIRIPDLRQGVLALSGRQPAALDSILDFVRATPFVSVLGPTLSRVTASGPVDTALRLKLPIGAPADFDLNVLFDARGCRLGLQPLPVDLKDLRGRVRLHNTQLSGERVRAVMLGEPVEIRLRPEPAGSAISHIADISGATPAPRLMSTFRLPGREYVDGRLAWDATVNLPARREPESVPLTVSIRSDLRGMGGSLPPPLRKAPDESWPTVLELAFPQSDVIEVSGSTQPPFAWALRLVSTADGWQVDRGELHAGSGPARIPLSRGVIITGRLGELPVNDWLGLGGGGEGRTFRETYRDITLHVDRLTLAGQVFPDTGISASRGTDAWSVTVTGPNAEGQISVPFDTANQPLVLDMQRLWLLESDSATGGGRTDPRNLVAAQVRAEDAALGKWRLGRLETSIEKVPDGLVARRISARAKSFEINGEGAWRVQRDDTSRQSTWLQATLQGNDIKDTLEQLGFDPGITGKELKVTVNLVWPDGPSGDFLARSAGEISIEMKKGQVMNLEPGSGRLLGLLSVTALPRRLSLDFRDVFNEGLAFDAIKGNFRVGSGSAYTCNLGLSGPVAEIAIVGRTGFATRNYDQVAVVRPQVSNVLTVGGAVLGGPVGGVTMALLSQLFRKPLSTLGESYYRVTGGWDQPDVARVERNQVQIAAFKDCEKEVVASLEAGAVVNPQAQPPGGTSAERR